MEENELVGELLQDLTNQFYNGNFVRCFSDLADYARFHEQLTEKLEPQQKGKEYSVGRNRKIGKKWVWHGATPEEFSKVFPDISTLVADFYAHKKVDIKLPHVKYPVLSIGARRTFNRIIAIETGKGEPIEDKLERYSKIDGLPMVKKVAYDYLFRKTLRKLALDYIGNFQQKKLEQLVKKYLPN